MSQANLISALRGGQPSAPGATTLQPGFTMFGNQPSTMPQTLQMPGLGNFGQNMLMGVPQTQAARTAMPGSAAARAAALRNPLGEPAVQKFFQPDSGMTSTVDMRQHGDLYNRELSDPNLSRNLGADMGMAQTDEGSRGGFYQSGDLKPYFTPDWSNPKEINQFSQYYDKGNPYFVTDTLDVNPGFAAYHNQTAQDALTNVTPDRMAQVRADQDAVHNRLYGGQLIAGRADINDAVEADSTMRGLLKAQSNRAENQDFYTQQALRASPLLAGADVSQGRLSYDQGRAIRLASGDAAALESARSTANLMDQQIAGAQKALNEYQWDKGKSDAWNRANLASLQSTLDNFKAGKTRAEQEMTNFGQKMSPYAQALADVTDPSGLSSADAIRTITGALRGGADQAPGEAVIQVVVYGPDGTMYGNPEAARRAGVTNWSTTPPNQNQSISGPVQQPMAVEAQPDPAPTRAARPTKTIEDRLAALNPKSRTYAQQKKALEKLQRQAQINALRG